MGMVIRSNRHERFFKTCERSQKPYLIGTIGWTTMRSKTVGSTIVGIGPTLVTT